jgi:drug/metabolite transporter (DMT)-like permease
MTASSPDSISPWHGRFLVLSAAFLWSLSGLFIPLLRYDTRLGLNDPKVLTWHIAFFRIFFAGLILTPTLRRRDITWRPAMIPMTLAFAAMNGLLMTAMSQGKTSDAILLQYTAPMWLFLISTFWLGEPGDGRSLACVLIGVMGVAVVVWGGWSNDQILVVIMALVSGFFYSLVLVGLRLMRKESPRWLTVLNHLVAALVLTPILAFVPLPSWPQLLCLAIFGAVQMALPYMLVARGLRGISAQEAGTLTLLEPILNTLWAYLISPDQQRPTVYTLVGGALILGALLFRYLPIRRWTK